jgi:hypothetical protein
MGYKPITGTVPFSIKFRGKKKEKNVLKGGPDRI